MTIKQVVRELASFGHCGCISVTFWGICMLVEEGKSVLDQKSYHPSVDNVRGTCRTQARVLELKETADLSSS